MLSASFFRDRATAKRYSDDSQREHGKGRAFCTLVRDGGAQVVEARQHCLVIKNRYPYDNWDNYGVIDQLMVIPRRHVVAFHELLPEEQQCCLTAITEYEAKGYSFYGRAPSAISKSIGHQHTHLIKIDDKQKNVMIYLRKPYFRIMR
ncbi:MAG: hypothetical protein HXL00_01010 [Candidatus Nanosynbacter sp.]|nr:hypothetical protein [Candidatus Nanosynbacter sp.]